MRTDLDSDDIDMSEALVSDSDLIGFNHPREVVRDPMLTLARKRQLLAYWASDVHALPGAPALRSYAFGPTVSIDDIKAAICQLDEMVDIPAIPDGPARGLAP
ncbi:MAG TPA: hypothetical protein VHA07_14545 [Devosia sp.]|nr:hypothetical protein [Devosia sp.]